MSWIRLLNTSRSFTGQDGEPRGYRLTQMNLIPKFGNASGVPSVTNPDALAAPAKPFQAAGSATRKIVSVVPLPRGTPAPAMAPAPMPKSISVAERVALVRVGAARLAGVLGVAAGATVEFSRRLIRRRETQPFAAPIRPAQPELRLEAIRPVHNDLSDCDYEVRPVRRAAPESAPAAPLAVVESELPPARETGVFALAGDAVERVRTLFH